MSGDARLRHGGGGHHVWMRFRARAGAYGYMKRRFSMGFIFVRHFVRMWFTSGMIVGLEFFAFLRHFPEGERGGYQRMTDRALAC